MTPLRSLSFNGQVQPTKGVAGVKPYSVPRHPAPADIKLDANEGEAPSVELLTELARIGPDLMRRYPDTSAVQAMLAARFNVAPECVIVTAGGDDALDRLCRAVMAPGSELLTTDPSFEMLPRYARIMGAEVREVPWPESTPFPTDDVVAAVTPQTRVVAFVSPNNPTGSVGNAEDLRRLSAAAPHAILLADFAYMEFAEEDLTDAALALPNVVMVRTLSKAFGLAGLRVGYAVGPAEVIGWMRASGGPYAVARPSIALAALRLSNDDGAMPRFVRQVREDRSRIEAALKAIGAESSGSQGNFVFTKMEDPLWVRDVLAGLGIAIRAYPGNPRLGKALRITCPGHREECDRLVQGIIASARPDTVVVWFEGLIAQDGRLAADAQTLRQASRGTLLALAARSPRREVEAFLKQHGMDHLFKVIVCQHEISNGGAEQVVSRAVESARATSSWTACAQSDDLMPARRARSVPFAISPKTDEAAIHSLQKVGAARVFPTLAELLGCLHETQTLSG